MSDYRTARDGGLPGHTITVDGEEVPFVFEFCVSEGWVRAYSAFDPCPACGHNGGEKHLRWWGGPPTREWSATGGRAWPVHPDPTPCWLEIRGAVQLLGPGGEDVTEEYLNGMRSAATKGT